MLLNGKRTTMTFIPRGNNVLLERLAPDDMTAGGLHLPDTAKENPLMAKVIAVGPGKEVPFGQRTTKVEDGGIQYTRFERIANVLVGDIVFFNIRHAVPCERSDSSRLCIVDADQILAVVKQGE